MFQRRRGEGEGGLGGGWDGTSGSLAAILRAIVHRLARQSLARYH